MIDIVEIIHKEFKEKNKKVQETDTKLVESLNKEQQLQFHNLLLLIDYSQNCRERELISFVLDFVSSIWSKRKNKGGIITFD